MAIVYAGVAIFLRDVFKSVSPELKLKGIFILIGLITFSSAALFDGWFELKPIPLIVTRFFVVISSIEVYIGWIMPESVKTIFLREKS